MISYTNKFNIALTIKSTEISTDNITKLTVPKNHLIIFTENDNFDFSALDEDLVLPVSSELVRDYIFFLKCDLLMKYNRRNSKKNIFICRNEIPELFIKAVHNSKMDRTGVGYSQLTRSLIFTILSRFLEQPEFMHFLICVNRECTTSSVSLLLQSAPQYNWNLSLVAKSLCLSNSLLKKKLKDEDTCYSKLITNCRMSHAIKLLQTYNGNIDKISFLCGYKNTSYFISVFKTFYGVTPYKIMKNSRG